ncbi:hypothetical protein [Klebsiella phage BUCT_49532]|uniref:hypothetical protein n=1 Tax=Klebsiella phage BUCT_49532 TaxID=2849971 RepID=UPI001C7506B8|nr:hypothetical protein PQZ56_gp60 [Klebsiella phage BUCT_49532]WCI99756.1 hypothetical protein [Klebsiella phage BUCT_49532]
MYDKIQRQLVNSRRKFWYVVWQISEMSGIPLGKCAPWVFEQWTGLKGEKK